MTMYWRGGSGTWDESTTGNWSNTSGGASNGSVPNSSTDVVFNASSGAGTCTLSGSPVCKTLTVSGMSVTMAVGGASLTASGSVNLTGLVKSGNLGLVVNATGTLTSGGTALDSLIMSVGTVTLGDALTATNGITVSSGTLNANNFDVSTSTVSGSGTFTMGSGTWSLSDANTCWNISAGATVNANTSTIKLISNSATDTTFAGQGKTYNNFWNATSGAGTCKITGANTFNDFKVDANRTQKFTAGTTTTVTSCTFGSGITLAGITASTWTLSQASGTATAASATITNSTATGGATFTATGGSTNGGGNSGWTFTVAPTVTGSAASSVATTTMTGNGNIAATGGINPTRRGFCYKTGTSGDPTIADSVAYDDGSFSTGAYTKAITGLVQSTSYRVRAYATNSEGTSYGTTTQEATLAGASGNFLAFF